MKKQWLRISIAVGILILAAGLASGGSKVAQLIQNRLAADILLLDPGHGGIDGGAQSSRGALEKSINLQIAQEVKRLAEDAGWRVVMTRETDAVPGGERTTTIRSWKTQDMKARRELIRRTQPYLAISIHLNSFRENPAVEGVQVFYPGEGGSPEVLEKSKKLSEVMQEKIMEQVQSRKRRVPMVKNDVFLFKEVTCPMVLVECGFLSNPQEAERLQTGEYQQKLARGIMEGIAGFSGKKPQEKVPFIVSKGKNNGR